MPVLYKGLKLPTHYRADFVCFDDVVLELKAIRQISGVEDSQLINYLKATGLQVGLLLNFGAPSLEWKRFYTIAQLNFAPERSRLFLRNLRNLRTKSP